MSKFESPEINAGSMADIAFLLLIFFLVTTTMDNELGIVKLLPKKDNHTQIEINERNVLEVAINSSNELLIENSKQISLQDLKQHIIDFIDNGSLCVWCNGAKSSSSSDHPSQAIIVLQASRNTSYRTYIAVQDEINMAYYELRNKLSSSLYGVTYKKLEDQYRKNKNNFHLKEMFENIRSKYPMLISEKEPENQS